MTKPKSKQAPKKPVTLAEAVEHHARAVEHLARSNDAKNENWRHIANEAIKRVDDLKKTYEEGLKNPPAPPFSVRQTPFTRPPSPEEVAEEAQRQAETTRAGGAGV